MVKEKIMTKEELMIGDWFFIDHCSNRIEPCFGQVKGIDKNGEDVYTTDGMVDISLLKPVSLTAEMLEQNGFVTKDKPDNWTGYRSYKYSEGSTGIIFRLYHDTGKYKWSGKCEISLNAPPYWIRFEYLHELQHILKICGIDKEIKIKLED